MPGDNVMVNVLLVDDEKEACTNLKNILGEYFSGAVNVIGRAYNTKEAEKLITRLAPDALFLDIEMPNENAFHFLERISPFKFEVVFVTAYDEYALRAFKLNAVDYILKPISLAELQQAVEKLKEKVKLNRMLHQNLVYNPYVEISNLINNKTRAHRIALKDSNVVEVVDFKDIYFVEAQGSYIRVLFYKDSQVKEIVMSGSLTDYEELLPTDIFFRIHKTYVINCMHVKKIVKEEHAEVIINNIYKLPISRRRYTPLVDFLKSNNYYHE